MALTRWEFSGNSYWPLNEAMIEILHWSTSSGRLPLRILMLKPMPSQWNTVDPFVTTKLVSLTISAPTTLTPAKDSYYDKGLYLYVLDLLRSWSVAFIVAILSEYWPKLYACLTSSSSAWILTILLYRWLLSWLTFIINPFWKDSIALSSTSSATVKGTTVAVSGIHNL